MRSSRRYETREAKTVSGLAVRIAARNRALIATKPPKPLGSLEFNRVAPVVDTGWLASG